MQALDHDAYLRLSADAKVLEADRYGDKVLRLADGNFLKLFRRKRLLSSALYYPYAQRFADNAKLLQTHDIPCPKVLAVYRVSTLARDVVHYQPLPGETLRQLYLHRSDSADRHLKEQLGAFIATLHDRGIYFRSLHLGNIVLTPDHTLGLIDISDLKGQTTPLGRHKRLRNFRHMLRYTEDRRWLLNDAGQAFWNAYIAASTHPAALALANQLKTL
ncbi:toluene tolerance protein [Pseudomonas indoloxydans]|jgi:tRNA A-37 threonylcarbamoyl transferase component Bud32|uniref:Toluene tolerance protein n=1 Tax=Ectopseudomonas oleovorans TaxID=301 RepID=A0A2T5PJ24_ECTOL|nr:lipopolysaccharide kinase InaA family protein [Pseudomonas indoloxydans]PTU77744.1 toluene tolerance protein [Pseudomonas indoloxydans]